MITYKSFTIIGAYTKWSQWKNTVAMKTLRPNGENKEESGRANGKEKKEMSLLTAEELAEKTGGGERNITVTHSEIISETVAHASIWPRSRPDAEEFKD